MMGNRLKVGGLALILNSIFIEMVGKTCTLTHHIGIHKSGITGHVGDAWEILVDDQIWIIRSDWLLPLGDDEAIKLYKLDEELPCNT